MSSVGYDKRDSRLNDAVAIIFDLLCIGAVAFTVLFSRREATLAESEDDDTLRERIRGAFPPARLKDRRLVTRI